MIVARNDERGRDATLGIVGGAVGRGIGPSGAGLLALYGKVRVVVVLRKDALATRKAIGGGSPLSHSHRLTEAHQLLLPYREAIKPADALVNRCGPHLAVGGGLEVEERLSTTHGEALVSGCPEQGLIVAVAVAREVVVAVYRAALDVNPDLWPLAEGLGLRLGVGRIYNIVEGTGLTIDDVQTSGKLLARPGTRHQIVLGTTGDIEGGIRGHIVIDKDIERSGILGIDARGISHVGAAGGAEQIIPVAGIAIGGIVVDAEVLLVGCPAAVLQL